MGIQEQIKRIFEAMNETEVLSEDYNTLIDLLERYIELLDKMDLMNRDNGEKTVWIMGGI